MSACARAFVWLWTMLMHSWTGVRQIPDTVGGGTAAFLGWVFSTYLRIPVPVVDKRAASHEPKDQLLVPLIPRPMEVLRLHLDAKLNVLLVPELHPALVPLPDGRLGQLKVVLEALDGVKDVLGIVAVVTLAFGKVDGLVPGLVIVVPDLLGGEDEVNREEFFADQVLLRGMVSSVSILRLK